VYNRGINSSWILSSREERDYFCRLLFEQQAHFKLEIYHCAVMSNHFHLAIETLDSKVLSAYIGRVSALYSKYWCLFYWRLFCRVIHFCLPLSALSTSVPPLEHVRARPGSALRLRRFFNNCVELFNCNAV